MRLEKGIPCPGVARGRENGERAGVPACSLPDSGRGDSPSDRGRSRARFVLASRSDIQSAAEEFCDNLTALSTPYCAGNAMINNCISIGCATSRFTALLQHRLNPARHLRFSSQESTRLARENGPPPRTALRHHSKRPTYSPASRTNAMSAASRVFRASNKTGGEGGIRTPVTIAGKPDFESGAFGHSATSPRRT